MRNSLFPLCFRVAETGNPLIGWNCHVSVVFPEHDGNYVCSLYVKFEICYFIQLLSIKIAFCK